METHTSQPPLIHSSRTLTRCHWLWWNCAWHRSNRQCQGCMCCLAQPLCCLGTPLPAHKVQTISCAPPRLLLPTCWAQSSRLASGQHWGSFHLSFLSSFRPSIRPRFHLSNLPSLPSFHPHALTLPHSAHFPVSHRSECQFVPSLTARLSSNHHGQRERNILQICNSLQHWTCSNVSLLEGRKEGRHVQTVV